MIDELEKVKVNEEEITDFMPEIYRKLEWREQRGSDQTHGIA